MTRRPGWAEKKCREGNTEDLLPGTPVISQWLAHQHLEREHRRALRVVQELEGKAKSDSSYTTAEKDWVLAIYRGVRLALQRSRT